MNLKTRPNHELKNTNFLTRNCERNEGHEKNFRVFRVKKFVSISGKINPAVLPFFSQASCVRFQGLEMLFCDPGQDGVLLPIRQLLLSFLH